jgi:methylmalonyl-CoA/ethylmalonyl-CoA epimerase
MRLEAVDHVAVAVPDLGPALDLFEGLLGGEFITGGDDDRVGIRVVHLQLPALKLELIEPLGEGSFLHRYLDRKGPGFHHLTAIVASLDEAMDAAREQGFEVIDERRDDPAWEEAFLRPSQTFGALVQLVQSDRSWRSPVAGVTREAVLAGKVSWVIGAPRLRDAADEPVG